LVTLRLDDCMDENIPSLLNSAYILSYFKTPQNSNWFNMTLAYLDDFKNADGIYKFPNSAITNVGENKKSKNYREILSTYWMYRINNTKKNNKTGD
jgi:hypothetical protein